MIFVSENNSKSVLLSETEAPLRTGNLRYDISMSYLILIF